LAIFDSSQDIIVLPSYTLQELPRLTVIPVRNIDPERLVCCTPHTAQITYWLVTKC